jgi:hypothetical protein
MFGDYFATFSTLRELILKFPGVQTMDDHDDISGLLNNVFVGYEPGKLPSASTPFFSQSEIVDQVISICFKNKTSNIMTLGYVAASARNPNNQLGSLINNFPNTLINELKSKPWEMLLNMYHF